MDQTTPRERLPSPDADPPVNRMTEAFENIINDKNCFYKLDVPTITWINDLNMPGKQCLIQARR